MSWLTEHLATHRLAERFPSLLWGEREWLLLLTVRDDIFTAICDGITEVTARYLAAPDRAAWCERQHVDKATISLLRRADELLGAA